MPINRRSGSPNNFFSDDEFGLADVGRLIKDLDREPAALREMRMRLEKAQTGISAINSLEAHAPGTIKQPTFAKALLGHQRAEVSLLPRISLYEDTRQERMSAQAVNSVGREFSDSSVNSYVARNLNSIGNQGAGLAGAANTSYSDLRKRQETIRGEMGRVRQRALNSAENLYDEEGNLDQDSVKKLHKSQVRFKALANELTSTTASVDQAKRDGKDPQSRLLALTKAQQNATGVLNTNNLEEQMRNGTGLGALSQKDLKQKEADASLKLIKAMEDLRNSFGKGDEALESFTEKAEEAAKELEEVQDAQGMGGGGGKYDSAKIIAGAVAEALAIITTGYQNVAINQPMQMVANVQGAANIENEKYNMWHSALGGDMTARMSLGAWEIGDAFGDQQAGRQNIVHAARMGTHGIAGGLGIVQIAEADTVGIGGAFLGNNRVEATAQGAKSAISGGIGLIQEGAAWARQTEKAALRIDGTHAVVNAAKALNHIPGHQLQKYRDYVMGLNEAAGQMGGSAGEAFLNETGGTDFLAKMRKEGVGLKEMGALSAQGAGMMGSMFKSSHAIDAVRFENLGFGSSEQNMQRMGMLGAAGTQDPSQNLAKIIEEGMQRGLNSSKAIDMLVENTARMTEENALAGGTADPTAFLTKILGAIDQNNPNDVMAGRIAMDAYQSGEAARHNISASFPGIINVDRNAETLGLGKDRKGAALLTQIPTAMLNSYKDKSPEELKTFLESRGVSHKTMEGMDQSLFENGKLINILNKNASISELAQSSGVGYAIGSPGAFLEEILKNKDNAQVTNALLTGNDPNSLTDDQRTLRQGVIAGYSLNGLNGAAHIRNAAVLAGVEIPKETNKTLDEMALEYENSTRAAGQNEKRLGNRADADTAAQGGKALGADAGGAQGIKSLAETGRVAFEKAGKDAENSWRDAASKTAQNFGKSAGLLDKATGKLDDVATKLGETTDAWQVVTKSFETQMSKLFKDLSTKADELRNKL